MSQVPCRRFTLRPQSFESPAFGTKLESPFTITLPADSPLCKLFASDAFFAVDLDLPVRPEIPLGIFSNQLLDNLAGTYDVKSDSGLDLDELGLDEITVAALKNGGVTSIEQLKAMPNDELITVKGIGEGRLGKIRLALETRAVEDEDEGDPGGDPDPSGDGAEGKPNGEGAEQ